MSAMLDARPDVDALEPFIPRAAHEVALDLPGDENDGVRLRHTARHSLDRRSDVEVPAVEKVAEGIQHALVDRHAHRAEQSLAVSRGTPLIRETLDRCNREPGIRKRQEGTNPRR